MLRGACKIALDAKGRLAIPVKYRAHLLSRAEGRLVVTVDPDSCLLIYPLPDWEETDRKFRSLSSTNRMAKQLRRFMVGHATDLQMDAHGRVLLPSVLREFAGLDKQAMLVGQTNKFELWDEGRWNSQRDDWLSTADGHRVELPDDLKTLSW